MSGTTGRAVETRDERAIKKGEGPSIAAKHPIPDVHVEPHQMGDEPMVALQWRGKKRVTVQNIPRPTITDPQDVVLRVTSTAICGSDLHLYLNGVPGMKSGDVMGHEFMGIVQEVGPEARGFSAGDRVVSSFDIGCGLCFFCGDEKIYSACDTTNPSNTAEEFYGQRTGGFFGYSHLTGGWPGGQAEYVRVPFADVNLLKVPNDLSDDQVLFLSDILPTAWHANELGNVHEGDVVGIWGAGPVGILSAQCAFHRGAKRVILIDSINYRLDHARKVMPRLETLNFDEVKSVVDTLKHMTKDEPGRAIDVGIDAVGMHYAKSVIHKVEMALQMETDAGDAINEILAATRKGGRISVVGAYVGYVNHFNIGALMEKHLTMRGGQTPVQRYWSMLLEKVRRRELDPTVVITHHLPLKEAPEGYRLFNDKKDNCIKVVLHPLAGWLDATKHGAGTGTQDVGQHYTIARPGMVIQAPS